ncbi:glycosyltransferase family 2 protein [Mucilaginibacter sp. UR6-11]|uniref:glycosyltransferase family 2 protein n=1 Tax=Mucilaginibacter sp. UR6-11 TaxID=1435644 RepID=UPI001E4005F4|nr:glycosyltransferase family 2 protein [Mucilaginibacter sp. UR6-11]MCC8425734.1 glycosyltransferase [Mucilaginibacter sp. UR6-11]
MDISIIIPTYNRLWSLPKTIDSCGDPHLKIQIIIVDDGSTDGTWDWLQQQKDLIAIRQENRGKDWAVNAGFALATGKYVRFLDSDDWILPGSSRALFNEAEKNNLNITCAGYQLYTGDEKLIKEISWTVCDDFIAQQLGECDSSHYSAYLFKKDFIKDIPHRQEFGALDDRQFIIEAAMKQPVTGYINQATLAHRVHNRPRLQNMGGLKEIGNHLAYLNIYQKAFDILKNTGQLTQRRKNAACNNLWHLAHWIAKTNIADGHKIYNWVYELNPQFKPAENKNLATLYKTFGFAFTEHLLKLKRSVG